MISTWTGEVDAKLEAGQRTGFMVNKGDVLHAVAIGWVSYNSGATTVGPQGDKNHPKTGLICQEAFAAALLGKIGDHIFPVNTGLYRWPAPISGELVFLVNDQPGMYGDNSGSFTVQVGKEPFG